MPHFFDTKRSDQIVKREANKHVSFHTLFFKHGSILGKAQLCNPFNNLRRPPIRNIELMAHEWAASYALAVEYHVDFNGAGSGALELNLHTESLTSLAQTISNMAEYV